MLKILVVALGLAASGIASAQTISTDRFFYYVDRNASSFQFEIEADVSEGNIVATIDLISPDVPEWNPVSQEDLPETGLTDVLIDQSGPILIELTLNPGVVSQNEAGLAAIRISYQPEGVDGRFIFPVFLAFVDDPLAGSAPGTSFEFTEPRELFLCQQGESRERSISVTRNGNSDYATIVPITYTGFRSNLNQGAKNQQGNGGSVVLNDDSRFLLPSVGFAAFSPTQTEAFAPATFNCDNLPRESEDLMFGDLLQGEAYFGTLARAAEFVPFNVSEGEGNVSVVTFQNGLAGMDGPVTPTPTPTPMPTPMPTPPPVDEDGEICPPFTQSENAEICVFRKSISVLEADMDAPIDFRRRGDLNSAVMFDYRLIPVTAQAGTDYSDRAGTITFSPGDTIASVNIPIIDNEMVTGDRAFDLEIINPVNAGIVMGFSKTRIMIIDKDRNDDDVVTPPAGGSLLSFATNRVQTSEANGPISIEVTRRGNSSAPTTVLYSLQAQSAIEGRDYGFAAGALNWDEDDVAPKIINIPIFDNNIVDGDLSFLVNLINPEGSEITPFPSVQVVILDDDEVASPSILRFTQSAVSVSEGDGTINIGLGRFGDTRDAAKVVVRTVSTGSAVPGLDFTSRSTIFEWAEGDGSSRQFDIPIIDNETVDGSRTFRVEMINAEGVEIGEPSATLVTILDNDEPLGISTVRFLQTGISVSEANGQARLSVARFGDVRQAGSVVFTTQSDTAFGGSDYTETSGLLTWDAGESGEREIIIPINDNDTRDGNRRFRVALSAPTDVRLGSDSIATVTIIDDEADAPMPGIIGIVTAADVIVQRESGQARISIERSGSTMGSASVVVGLRAGSATGSADYDDSGFPITLTWGPGENGTRIVTVPLTTGDELFGVPARQFTVTLESAEGSNIASGGDTTRVTIVTRQTPENTGIGAGSTGTALLLVMGALALARRRMLKAV